MYIQNDGLTINQLLNELQKAKSKETPDFDTNNILIAVNEIDSSVLDGLNTKLQSNDIVSIIPVIHGGSPKTIEMEMLGNFVTITKVEGKNLDQNFLDSLRKKFPKLSIQGISSKFILSKSHAIKIIALSIEAQKSGTLLSNKIETDILLRFAGTKQILDAIYKAGIQKSDNFLIIALGSKTFLKKLSQELLPVAQSFQISDQNSKFLKRVFRITDKQINSIQSKTPLEDILCEKSAILLG